MPHNLDINDLDDLTIHNLIKELKKGDKKYETHFQLYR